MLRRDVEALDPRKPHWVAAVTAPTRNWPAAPGCRAHARFLIDGESKAPSLSQFELFDTRAHCLEWIIANGRVLNIHMPGAKVHPVPLADWLLGLC
jgi:hypothetical protein